MTRLGSVQTTSLLVVLILFLHRQSDRIQYKIDRLSGRCLVSHNAIVIQIPDDRQIQYPLLRMDVGDVRNLFRIRPVCLELSVQQILVLMYLLPKVNPFPATADLR